MKFIDEKWLNIKGYKNYKISNFGRIWSNKRNKILKTYITKFGYEQITLWSEPGKRKSFRVHQLVASHFIKNYDKSKIVNHIDCNKLNNHIDNLEYITHKENIKHAFNNDLISCRKGENNNQSKLSTEEVLKIKKAFNSSYRGQLDDLSKEFNVSRKTIEEIKYNRRWSHI